MKKYSSWMKEYRASINGSCRGMCGAATSAMQLEFPELTRVRGHVVVLGLEEEQPHWWMTTKDGEVLDPTADQFDEILAYLPHDESGPEPVGKCLNCGEYVYAPHWYFCSDDCESVGRLDLLY